MSYKISLGTIVPMPPVSSVKLCRRTRVKFKKIVFLAFAFSFYRTNIEYPT